MNIILFRQHELSHPLPLEDRRARHILKVLKLREGDSFVMGVIQGPRGTGIIQSIGAKGLKALYTLNSSQPPHTPFPVTMIIGLIRPIAARRLLKDLTTLGVERIWFTHTNTGEKSYIQSNLWQKEEYTKQLIQGAEQGVTTYLPQVRVFYSLKQCLAAMETEIPRDQNTEHILLDNDQAGASLRELPSHKGSCFLAVGSERGWSDRERLLFKTHHFTPYRLGPQVLRTETACLTGLSLVLFSLGHL